MARFQFNNKKEPLSDQEINSRMNFDQFLAARPAPVNPRVKIWKAAGITTVAAAVAVVSYFIAADSPGAEKKQYIPAFIHPPLPEVNTAPFTFSVNTAKDTQVVSARGSEINVPRNAFVFANGTPVNGNVELHYREFHDQIEIMMSGIPMQYDSAGKQWLLESAGMFEITATQNGTPLQLAPGREINVRLISNRTDNDYNIYYLDTVKRNWQYISDNTRESGTCSEPLYFINEKEEEKYNTLLAAPAPVQPVQPFRATPGATTFSIDYVRGEFPELEAYDGLKFEPLAGDENFDEKMAQQTWENIEVEHTGTPGIYSVQLSAGRSLHTFDARVVTDAGNYEQAISEFNRRDKIYREKMKLRTSQLNALRDSMYNLNEALVSNVRTINYNDKFNAFVTGDYNNMPKSMLVYRTVRVQTLGIWNCDRPRNFFDELSDAVRAGLNKVLFSAVFVNAVKKKLNLKVAFLVRNEINTVCPVSADKFENSFPFMAGEIDMVIGVTDDNKICYSKGADLQRAQLPGNKLEFVMQEPAKPVSTVDELKALLKK
ncbi:MAG: hypothetical protein IM638_15500 [Bacteroidetes bacterium]|nr:hypothetical protein [Bacteroidota bacterium]